VYDLRPDLNVANDQILANRPFVYFFRLLVLAADDSLLNTVHQSVIGGAFVTCDTAGSRYFFFFTGGMGADSVVRIGTIEAGTDSGIYHKGSRIWIRAGQYYEDNHRVTGTDSIVCTGISGGLYLYDDHIPGAVIMKDSLRTISFNADYRVTVSRNIAANRENRSVLTFEGTSSGISSGGYPYTCTVSPGLSVSEACPWIKDGIISFSIPGVDIPAGTIEFMAKTGCNENVRYNFQGTVYDLQMDEKHLRN